MDNQNTTVKVDGVKVEVVLILVLMDNQNTNAPMSISWEPMS